MGRKQLIMKKIKAYKPFVFLLIAILMVIIALSYPLIVKYWIRPNFTVAQLGTVGDWFGGLSGPLIGLASFILVYATFFLQREQSIKQEKTTNIQQFETSFFQLLSFHHKIVDNLRIHYEYDFGGETAGVPSAGGQEQLTGVEDTEAREFFVTAHLILTHGIKKLKDKSSNQSKELQNSQTFKQSILEENYNTFYNKHQASVGHYFRNLYHIVKYIHLSKLLEEKDKKLYIGILRAQLSSHELVLLFYNVLIEDLGYPKFNYLAKKYDILQNMNGGLLLDCDDQKIYDSKIVTENPFEP